MPNCRKCNAPIFFLGTKPTTDQDRPKVLPIDVNPDPKGTVAIVEDPPANSIVVRERNWKGERKKYMARLYGEALKSYVRLGGAVYRIHFDTCPGR